MRPPTFEVTATPNRDMAHVRQFERPIDPAATAPSRWSHVPIGMIIKGYQGKRVTDATQPKCAQMMKIARAVKNKVAESRRDFAKKAFCRARRNGETQSSSPLRRVDRGKIGYKPAPGVVEIEMDRPSRIAHGVSRERKRESVARAMRRFSAASAKSGLSLSASSNCTMACEVRPCRR